MKIGVALSGCDLGGLSALYIIKMLEEAGFELEMISACCAPALPAMLYGCGIGEEKSNRLLELFWEKTNQVHLDSAIGAVADQIPARRLAACKNVAVSSVHVEDGRIVTFTNAFSLDTDRLKSLPLTDAYDALSATASLLDGLGLYRYKGYRLCDFSSWYGCPLYPLRMMGIRRTLSIAFVPAIPDTAYEALVRQSVARASTMADVHIAIEFPKLESLESRARFAAEYFEGCMNRVYLDIT